MSNQTIPQRGNEIKEIRKGKCQIAIPTHTGYFCYDCIYFVKSHHCVIVTDEGEDVNGRTSSVIAPHGICALWEQNEEEIR